MKYTLEMNLFRLNHIRTDGWVSDPHAMSENQPFKTQAVQLITAVQFFRSTWDKYIVCFSTQDTIHCPDVSPPCTSAFNSL